MCSSDLYKYGLQSSAKSYYIKNYIYLTLFAASLIALHFAMISSDNQWIELFANGGISLAFSIVISVFVIMCNKDFRYYMKSTLRRFAKRKKEPPINND